MLRVGDFIGRAVASGRREMVAWAQQVAGVHSYLLSLHHAVASGCVSFVEWLLEQGVRMQVGPAAIVVCRCRVARSLACRCLSLLARAALYLYGQGIAADTGVGVASPRVPQAVCCQAAPGLRFFNTRMRQRPIGAPTTTSSTTRIHGSPCILAKPCSAALSARPPADRIRCRTLKRPPTGT